MNLYANCNCFYSINRKKLKPVKLNLLFKPLEFRFNWVGKPLLECGLVRINVKIDNVDISFSCFGSQVHGDVVQVNLYSHITPINVFSPALPKYIIY